MSLILLAAGLFPSFSSSGYWGSAARRVASFIHGSGTLSRIKPLALLADDVTIVGKIADRIDMNQFARLDVDGKLLYIRDIVRRDYPQYTAELQWIEREVMYIVGGNHAPSRRRRQH